MALNKLELYLHREVISKVKYDELTGEKTIYLKDYAFLNLTKTKMLLLQKICHEYGIHLEQLPPKMKVEETQTLLKEYNRLKRIIESNPNNSDNERLNSIIYQIKEKVALGHMQLVFDLINRSIKDICETQDMEDIYQIGYETLLEFIDKYDDTKNTTFIYYLSRYLIFHIKDKIVVQLKGLEKDLAYELKQLTSTMEKLNISKINDETLQQLSLSTGWSIKRIKGLLSIEKMLENIEIDSYGEDNLPQDLISMSFEEDIIEKILKDNNHLEKALFILTPIQRRVLRLYYGLEDGKKHSYDEITIILKQYSGEGIRKMIRTSLEIISNSISFQYLNSIYGTDDYQYSPDHIRINNNKQKELLLTLIPKSTIKEIVECLGSPYIEILNLYYGLKDNLNYSCDEISKILKLSINQVVKIKNHGTDLILKTITKRLAPKFTGNYLEYMTNYYLNNTPKRK